MLQRFHIDTRPLYAKPPKYWRDLNYTKLESFVDEGGALRKRSGDFATQQSLFISPDTFRKMIKPYHQELIQHIKRKTQAKVLLHTCGAVRPLLPDLIEIGVDIIQPVQVSAVGMDTAELKREFGSRLSFWGGGCDSQKVLPHGSVDDVRAEVEKRMGDLAPGGGFVFSPVHNVQFDVPPENVVAMFDHALKLSKGGNLRQKRV